MTEYTLNNADDPRTIEVVQDVTDILNAALATLTTEQACDVLCIVSLMLSNYMSGIVADVTGNVQVTQ